MRGVALRNFSVHSGLKSWGRTRGSGVSCLGSPCRPGSGCYPAEFLNLRDGSYALCGCESSRFIVCCYSARILWGRCIASFDAATSPAAGRGCEYSGIGQQFPDHVSVVYSESARGRVVHESDDHLPAGCRLFAGAVEGEYAGHQF